MEINVGNLFLKDRFEWDVAESSPIRPEEFAKRMAADLGLGSEFVSNIAYAIREQIYMNRRMKMNNKAPRKESFNVTIRESVQVTEWQPVLERLTDAELEKLIQDKERNARRVRRETRTRLQQRKDEETRKIQDISFGNMSTTTSLSSIARSQASLPLQPRGRGRPPLYLSKISSSTFVQRYPSFPKPVDPTSSIALRSSPTISGNLPPPSPLLANGGLSVASLEGTFHYSLSRQTH